MRAILGVALVLPRPPRDVRARAADGPRVGQRRSEFPPAVQGAGPARPRGKDEPRTKVARDRRPRPLRGSCSARARPRGGPRHARGGGRLSKDLNALQVLLGMKRAQHAPTKDLAEGRSKPALRASSRARSRRERVVEDWMLRAGGHGGVEPARGRPRQPSSRPTAGREGLVGRARSARGSRRARRTRRRRRRRARRQPRDGEGRSGQDARCSTRSRPRRGRSGFPLVVARINDPEWGVELMAIRIAGSREMGKAIPALIQALAGCRVRAVGEEIVASLRKLTGQSMEAYPSRGRSGGRRTARVGRRRPAAPADGLRASRERHRDLRHQGRSRAA